MIIYIRQRKFKSAGRGNALKITLLIYIIMYIMFAVDFAIITKLWGFKAPQAKILWILDRKRRFEL